jgi:hypothetical protein
VLTGRAPELERFYPCLGGEADPAHAWPPVREVFAANIDELREALAVAPQTNEVGRANALLVGVFLAVQRTGRSRLRLLELGASAGLNLLVDRFRFVNTGWDFGPATSPVTLADGIQGAVEPTEFVIGRRRGCDVSPIDVMSADGRLRLRSFVWPFHVERHQRLAGAFALADHLPPTVDKASADAWLGDQLDAAEDDELTVVWQSITRQYWTDDVVERVDALVGRAGVDAPVAHVSMEYPGDVFRAELTLRWSTGSGRPLEHERIGTVGDHGFPVRIGG